MALCYVGGREFKSRTSRHRLLRRSTERRFSYHTTRRLRCPWRHPRPYLRLRVRSTALRLGRAYCARQAHRRCFTMGDLRIMGGVFSFRDALKPPKCTRGAHKQQNYAVSWMIRAPFSGTGSSLFADCPVKRFPTTAAAAFAGAAEEAGLESIDDAASLTKDVQVPALL